MAGGIGEPRPGCWWLALACLLISRFSAIADTLTGRVIDDLGTPIAGAHVLFTYEGKQRETRDTYTADDGSFSIDLDHLDHETVVGSVTASAPNGFKLQPNYPNPFNPSTLIPYHLGQAATVRLEIFDILGQRLRVLVDQYQEPGPYSVGWDGRDASGRPMASGLYLYRLQVGGRVASGKMVLLDGAEGGVSAPGVGSVRGFSPPSGKRSAGDEADSGSFRVIVVGDGIEPFVRHGVALSADGTFDIGVLRNPGHHMLRGEQYYEGEGVGQGGGSFSIDGDLYIYDAIGNLKGLSGLVAVVGNLEFSSNHGDYSTNNFLDTLEGLEDLRVVGGRVYLEGTNITSLSPLRNLNSVGELVFRYSSLQGPLEGLENLEGVGGLNIVGRGLGSLRGLESIDRIRGDVTLSITGLRSLEGLDNLTRIDGRLRIEHNDSLAAFLGLDNIEVVEGNLSVLHNQRLVAPVGLGALSQVGGKLEIIGNDSLQSLSGLDQLEQVGGLLQVGINENLTSLVGLDRLKRVGALSVAGNEKLPDLRGLDGLQSITGDGSSLPGDLFVRNNATLRTLDGLSALRSVAGDLDIGRNRQLKTLEGAEVLHHVGGGLAVWGNPELPEQEVQVLAEVLGVENAPGGSGAAQPPAVKNLRFADPYLETIVRSQLGNPQHPLSMDDVADFQTIYENPITPPLYFFQKVYSLDGVEYLPSLVWAYLPFHRINDLSPLEYAAKLEHLHLPGNRIADLSPLMGLSQLSDLDLSQNYIRNISPLYSMPKLKSIVLYYNQISDLSPLAGLSQLETINLGWNQIRDLSSLLENPNVGNNCHVDIRGNPLSEDALRSQVPELQQRGVDIRY